jgi:hypothetical protein
MTVRSLTRDGKCPDCGADRGGDGVHSNGVCTWCVRCGWGRNHDAPPGKATA